MTILFSGGGTLGSVTPLIAMKEMIARAYPDARFLWIGTRTGPEQAFVERAGIPFVSISSGKFRRYLSWWNITDFFYMTAGFFQSLVLLKKYTSVLCISAGGYVSVPVHAAAALQGIPTWIHQQDVTVGLANKVMARWSHVITSALEKNTGDFGSRSVVWIGNPIRRGILGGSKEAAIARFGLRADLPIVFATGGGAGSFRLNQLVVEAVQYLHEACQIVHISGGERGIGVVERAKELFPTYHVYDVLGDEMADIYAGADLVIARGGFGTLSELSALGKAAIIIPKGGHQEENAKFLEEAGAIVSLHEFTTNGQDLSKRVLELLGDPAKRSSMAAALQSVLPSARDEDVLNMFNTVTHAFRPDIHK